MKYMSIYPRESKLKKYSNYEDYPDSYKKYFMYGFLKKERINDPIRIYNIVGLACGFTIDIAYVENQKNMDGYFIASAMFTNENGKYSNGKIFIDGKNITHLPTSKRKETKIAYISDDRHHDGLLLIAVLKRTCFLKVMLIRDITKMVS